MGLLINQQMANRPVAASLLAVALICGLNQAAFAQATSLGSQSTSAQPESVFTQSANALRIYNQSGVQSHLLSVPQTIVEEAKFERTRCTGTKGNTVTGESINQVFNTRDMAGRFTTQLNEKLGPQKLREIAALYDSDLGKRVVKAEKSAVDLAPEQFEVLLQAYLNSTRWNQNRADVVSSMLNATGAVDFLSAVHTEISAAVVVASVCNTNQIGQPDLDKNVKKIRADEAFYLAFLRGEMVAPSAFVYRSLSTPELEEFTQFARSELGAEYFNSLVEITRSVVAQGVESLAELNEPD